MEERKKNAINFLLFSYFGITLDDQDNDEVIIDSAIDRAYRDASSHVLSVADSEKPNRQNDASKVIKCYLKKLDDYAEKYDDWHKDCIDKLFESYDGCIYKNIENKRTDKTYKLKFTYGIAQKWLNMTMKYLYILSEFFPERDICKKVASISNELHVPLDSYIIHSAEKELEISAEEYLDIGKWSKINDYEKYMEYQKAIRKNSSLDPIDWEGPAWIKVAKAKMEKTQGKKEKYMKEREEKAMEGK